jgi:ketosteroid isomerase-like protein
MAATTNQVDPAVAEVIAAEQERCRAVLASDIAVLDALVGDEYHNRHSDGSSEDKAKFLNRISTPGHSSYARDELDVRIYGDTAVMIGEHTITSAVRPDREVSSRQQNVLQVWTKRDGRWQLVAQQTANTAD